MASNHSSSNTEKIHQLAANLAEGDSNAIAKIYQLTYTPLYYFGLQIAGKHQEMLVEGTIQDFFIWLAKNYRTIDLMDNLEGYLYQSVRRNLQQQLQAKQAKVKAKRRYLERTEPNKATHQDSPELALLAKEANALNKELVDTVIKDLPTYQKEVLYLRFYENRNYKEIAEILSVNAQVARNYMFRALTGLRKKLLSIILF